MIIASRTRLQNELVLPQVITLLVDHHAPHLQVEDQGTNMNTSQVVVVCMRCIC